MILAGRIPEEMQTVRIDGVIRLAPLHEDVRIVGPPTEDFTQQDAALKLANDLLIVDTAFHTFFHIFSVEGQGQNQVVTLGMWIGPLGVLPFLNWWDVLPEEE